jgi:hypothetical protein
MLYAVLYDVLYSEYIRYAVLVDDKRGASAEHLEATKLHEPFLDLALGIEGSGERVVELEEIDLSKVTTIGLLEDFLALIFLRIAGDTEEIHARILGL